ncbi:MAG: diguanylate cyclase [Clostridia bacterium]|nr:diguanylate cyclase [Clostridia bacterium]
MKEYLLTNFVMLFEIAGILLIIRLSVNVSKRTVTATVLSFSFILLSSILYSVERWLGQQETLSVWRVVSSYAVYAMQPIIIFLTMQIAAPIKKKWIWLLAPELIGVILYVTSPWTKLVCWYNEWNDYQAGPLYRLPYMVFAFYIVVFLVQTIRYFRKYHVQEKICLVYVVSVSMGGMLFYLISDYVNDYNPIFTAAILLYYLLFYIQRSKVDSLTGLMNRQSFYKDIEKSSGHIKAIASVDMNGLKRINDTLGHHAGDVAIATIAENLLKGRKIKKSVYRVGGDEFVILYYAATEEDVAEDIEYMRKNLAKTDYVCAFGYSVVQPSTSVEDALKDSDEKMYEDKAALKKAALADGAETQYSDGR